MFHSPKGVFFIKLKMLIQNVRIIDKTDYLKKQILIKLLYRNYGKSQLLFNKCAKRLIYNNKKISSRVMRLLICIFVINPKSQALH